MPRRKSYQQILNQGRRLQFALGSSRSENALARMDRIDAIRARYERNIRRAYGQEADRLYNEARSLLQSNNPTAFDRANYVMGNYREAERALRDRQVSRSVYIGLNNG